MLHNQKGFTYPLTFCIIIIAIFVLSLQLEQFLTEKQFFKESEKLLQQDFYFLSSMKQVEEKFNIEEEEFPNGTIQYKYGDVSYSTTKLSDTVFKVSFTLKMDQFPQIIGTGYYDKAEGKMTKWAEKN